MIIEIIQKNLTATEDFIYGFADLRGMVDQEFEDYPFGISIGRRLDDRIIDQIENGPTSEYFQHYKDVNKELDSIASNIGRELKNKNINCINIAASGAPAAKDLEYFRKTLRTKISHKMVATRAGLGWIGKTDLFVASEYGPRVRLVSLLLNKELPKLAKPIEKSKCGKCDVCVIQCPAQAASGELWDVHTDRDLFFDVFKCSRKCAELSKTRLNEDVRICGICVSVCPIGKKQRLDAA